jgi:hypothetical protein
VSQRTRNLRLAIALGLAALAVYCAYVLMHLMERAA